MKYIKSLQLLFILSAGVFSYAQDARIDSLEVILKNLKEDTAKVNTLNTMAAIVHRTAPEDAVRYGSDAKNLSEQIDFQEGLALAYKNIGLGHYMQTEYTEAVKNWEASLALYEALGDEELVANLIGNLGSVYYSLGQNFEAIEYNLRALKIAERLGNSRRMATILMNIGSVYSEQASTLDTARNYYLRALAIGESIEYMDLLGVGTINLGEVYFKQGVYDSALYYFEKSLLIVTSEIDIAASLNSIAKIYSVRGDYQTALKYHQDALELAQKENAQLETARILVAMASTYSMQGSPQQAINYYERAKLIAEEIGLSYELSDAYEGLAFSYAEILDFRNAYKYMSLQDTVHNAMYKIETEDQTNNLMFSYQLEKKEDAIEILEQKSEIDQLKNKRQRAIIISTGLAGLFLLLLAIAFYNRFQFIRKTNEKMKSQSEEIAVQRDQIQLQHDMVLSQKEMITDSISYAERIQSAMLPSPSLLDELIPEYFIFFRPKDIVSGDFYWVKEVQDHLIIVGADCTGHGVPGAFMSMLGITLLNDLIGNRCYNAPGAVLEQLRLKIKELLVQEGNAEEAKDGMDMAMAVLDKKTREIYFSGANNPLYIIRNKEEPAGPQLEPYVSLDSENYQLFEIKGDKQPIGIHWEETKFTTHSILLQEQDAIYLFSDGFVDQFGGENRKKFKSINFKKLLLSIQEEPMDKQGQIIENTFDSWRGSYEQLDDISVIGVRI